MPEVRLPIGLPPKDTVEFFRAKGRTLISRRWWDVWQEEHVRARTIAGVNDLTVINAVYSEIDKVLADGGTLAMFKNAVLPGLQQAVANGSAPKSILTDQRLQIIYSTNLRMARAAGQWKRIEALKESAPWLMYSAVLDRRTRPLHRQWDSTILSVDDAWWDTHYPPCGWNCRCNVIQLSDRDLSTMALKPSSSPPQDGAPVDFIRGDGIIESVPRGIDPGFAYNVGKAHLRGLADALFGALETLADKNVGIAQAVLQDMVDQTAFDVFLKDPATSYPVMVLGSAERALLGSKSSVARLSSDTWAKQLRAHPELDLEAYRKLVNLAAKPDLILRQGDQRIVLVKLDGKRWLKAVVKTTSDGQELFLVSYQYADNREVIRLKRINEVVFDGAQ